jgi:hypothetical protein
MRRSVDRYIDATVDSIVWVVLGFVGLARACRCFGWLSASVRVVSRSWRRFVFVDRSPTERYVRSVEWRECFAGVQ